MSAHGYKPKNRQKSQEEDVPFVDVLITPDIGPSLEG